MRASRYAIACTLLTVACSGAAVSIDQAVVSRNDLRLELTLQSCNAELAFELDETPVEVVVSVSDLSAPIVDLGGNDCQDLAVLPLNEPLGNRTLIDASTGSPVDVRGPLPEASNPAPYDTSRFTEAEYLTALEAMVSCLERSDPGLDAWTYQALDWMTYRWHKEPDEDGYLERPAALDTCHEKHLKAMEAPDGERWTAAELEIVSVTWVNQLGLNRDDLNVWRDRLVEVCSAGEAGLGDLAARYVEEDAGVSVRGTADLPAAWEAAEVLARIAAPLCGD